MGPLLRIRGGEGKGIEKRRGNEIGGNRGSERKGQVQGAFYPPSGTEYK